MLAGAGLQQARPATVVRSSPRRDVAVPYVPNAGLPLLAFHGEAVKGDVSRDVCSIRRTVEQGSSGGPLLDLTPYGHGEPWEDNPEGWPEGLRPSWC